MPVLPNATEPAAAGLPPRCFALVPCAGVGLRAGADGPKQYALLAGRPVVAHTLAALAGVSRLAATLVVLAPDDEQFETCVPGFTGWVVRTGGATRAASVASGLQALQARGAADNDWVLVHDAARCLLRPAWVDRLIDACAADAVGGLLALPLADTLKDEGPSGSGRVGATVPRNGKWAAQTPQMFRLGLLQRALQTAAGADDANAHVGDNAYAGAGAIVSAIGSAITDEASAIEQLGLSPRLVPGEMENLKVTWPADFDLARRLLETR